MVKLCQSFLDQPTIGRNTDPEDKSLSFLATGFWGISLHSIVIPHHMEGARKVNALV